MRFVRCTLAIAGFGLRGRFPWCSITVAGFGFKDRFPRCSIAVAGFGFTVQGAGVSWKFQWSTESLVFPRVAAFVFRIQDSRFRVKGWGSWLRVQGLGFRAEGLGLRVEG